jgi:hypothetical protein
MLQKAND